MVALGALVPLVGYLYGVNELYGIARFTGIAWPTALAQLVLALGVLCARPEAGLMRLLTAEDEGGRIVRRLLLPALVLPVGLGWLRLLAEHAGVVDAALGTALVMILFIVVFSTLICLAGNALSRQIAATERQKELLAITLASIGDAVIVTDTQGRITFLNAEAVRLTGWDGPQAQGRPLAEVFHIINEQTREPVESPVDKVQRLGTVVGLANHTVLIARDGTERPIDDSGAPVRAAGGTVHGVVLVFRDIAERKRREERIAKLSRLYAVLSRVNEAIVHTRDVDTLYAAVCRIVAEIGAAPLVWIGEVRGRRIVPVARTGPAVDYLDSVQIEIDGPLGTGPGGTCIRENRVAVNDDFATNPQMAPWRTAVLRYGFRASAAFPLRRRGQPVAELTLYAREAGAFDAEQVALLEGLAADISYALDAFDEEQVRVRAEEALRLSEEKFALAFASNPAAITLTRLEDGQFLEVNDTWVELNGYSHEEIRHLTARTIPVWPTPEMRVRFIQELREKGSLRGWEQGLRKRSGETYVVQLSAAVLNVQGEQVILSTLVDITDRKRAEAARRESDQRLRFALDSCHIGAWDLDLVDHTAFRSREHDRIFGYQELLPRWTLADFLTHVLPDDRAEVEAKFQQATATRSDWNFECRIRRADGAVRWIWAAGRHQLAAVGGRPLMAGIVQDITAQEDRGGSQSRPVQRRTGQGGGRNRQSRQGPLFGRPLARAAHAVNARAGHRADAPARPRCGRGPGPAPGHDPPQRRAGGAAH